MLIALLNGMRIEAAPAERGGNYNCPNCKASVILKKGKIVTHHFAHRPPTDCTWASGETPRHLAAKIAIRDGLRARGLTADVEVEVLSHEGDRRADVLARSPENLPVAFEVQHQPILFDAIDRRTRAYVAVNVPVIWVGLLSEKTMAEAQIVTGGRFIEKYAVRPWERWAHTFGFGELWFLDEANKFWLGKFSEHRLVVESSSWHTSEGEERYAGGYTKVSRRWRGLTLKGPFEIGGVRIAFKMRNAWQGKNYSVPGGRTAYLAPPG